MNRCKISESELFYKNHKYSFQDLDKYQVNPILIMFLKNKEFETKFKTFKWKCKHNYNSRHFSILKTLLTTHPFVAEIKPFS